jgi:hypothetical protein
MDAITLGGDHEVGIFDANRMPRMYMVPVIKFPDIRGRRGVGMHGLASGLLAVRKA